MSRDGGPEVTFARTLAVRAHPHYGLLILAHASEAVARARPPDAMPKVAVVIE